MPVRVGRFKRERGGIGHTGARLSGRWSAGGSASVSRIDPAVQNGTVTVDITLAGPPPDSGDSASARTRQGRRFAPDRSVNGKALVQSEILAREETD